MSERDEIIDERSENNFDDFMERGPGLRSSYQSWVVAKSERGYTLLGGLGGMGVGEMWFEDYPDAHWLTDPTYENAPFVDYQGNGGLF